MEGEPDTRAQWRWLADTYWYVLPTDLPALQLDPGNGTLSWLVDQTVWHISGYKNGYFWGVTAALLYNAGEEMPVRGPSSRIAHLSMLGTVMPDGQVQITFLSNGRFSNTPTVGFGQMVKAGQGFAFAMQMSTDRRGNRVLHWANMVQTQKGDSSWNQLPGLEYSVPKMLEGAIHPHFDKTD